MAAIVKARRADRVAAPIVGGRERTGQAEPVHNPATGAVIGQVVEADAGAIDEAIASARKAQDDWSLAGGAFRAERLDRAADLIEGRERQSVGAGKRGVVRVSLGGGPNIK